MLKNTLYKSATEVEWSDPKMNNKSPQVWILMGKLAHS